MSFSRNRNEISDEDQGQADPNADPMPPDDVSPPMEPEVINSIPDDAGGSENGMDQSGTHISDEDAARMGWTPSGEDENGRQKFSLVDGGGDLITWSIDPGTGQTVDLRNLSQEKRDEAAANAGNGAPAGGFIATDPGVHETSTGPAIELPPGQILPVENPVDSTAGPSDPIQLTPRQLAFLGWTPLGTTDAHGNPQFSQIDGDSLLTFTVLPDGTVYDFHSQPAPISSNEPPTSGPGIIDTISPGGQVTPQPPIPNSTMTAEAYADSHRDLGFNWNNAQLHPEDPIANWILSFGTFANYLANDAASNGITFTAPDAQPEVGPGPYTPPGDPVYTRIYHPVSGAMIDVLPEWIRDGNDAAGNPKFHLVDAYGNRVNWVIDGNGQAANFTYGDPQTTSPVVNPPVVNPPVVNPPVVNPPIVNPVSTVRIYHPVTNWPIDVLPEWIRNGSDAAGNPKFYLIDAGGTRVDWIVNGQGQPILGQGVTGNGGGGGTTTPPPRVDLPGTGISPLFDPTHRLVGYTRQGYEVYRLTDEGGNLVEWYDIPGRGAQGQHYLVGANDPNSYVFTTTRPTNPPPATVDNTGQGKSGSNLLLLAGAAAAGWFLLRK